VLIVVPVTEDDNQGRSEQVIAKNVFTARPHTMEWIRDQVLASDRFSMYLFVSFGLIAVLLATLGIYGVA
jgi:hypothetical protein